MRSGVVHGALCITILFPWRQGSSRPQGQLAQLTTDPTQKMDRLVAAYEATLELYRRMQPLQEKMFRHLEQEIDDAEDADAWKYGDPEEGDEGEDDESGSS